MHTETAIIQAIQNYGYLALLPILIFGGPFAALGAGLVASQGFLSPWLIWPMAVFADLVSDIFWYILGRFGRERIYSFLKNFFAVADAAVLRAERLFERHGNKIIFFSKATMGLGLLGQFMLTLQGFLQIPFRVFILYNFLGGIILSGVASFGGYYFGLSVINMSPGKRIMTLVVFFIGVVTLGRVAHRISSAAWLYFNGKPTIHEFARDRDIVKES